MFRIFYFTLFALAFADWRFPYRDTQHSGAIFVNSTYSPFSRNLKGGAYTTAIGDDGTIFTSSGDHLIAINPANETIWTYDASGGQINSGNIISNFGNGPACIHDGRIFILSSNTTKSGFLVWGIHAIEVSTGNLLWRNMLQIETIGAATLMIGMTGIVYMNQMPLTAGEKSMIAFEPATGDIIWDLEFTDLNLFAMENPVDGTIIAAGNNKTKGIHPKTGEILWTSDDLIGFDFSIDEKGILYGIGFNLLALNASNGERIWLSKLPELSGAWWVPVTLSNGRLFMPYFPANGELTASVITAFDTKGNLLWNVTTCNGSKCGFESGSCNIVATGDIIYVAFANSVGAMDAITGSLLWSQSLGNNLYAYNIYAAVTAVETSLIVITSNEITNEVGMQVINVPHN